MENELVAEMTRVREYTEARIVTLERRPEDGRLVIVAFAHNHVEIDLFDILVWLHASGLAQLRLETLSTTEGE